MEKVFFLIVQSFNYMIYYEDSCVKKSVFSLRGIVGMALWWYGKKWASGQKLSQ